MNFYPDVKAHMSPSAMEAWYSARGSFVKSYFDGVRSPETAAMRAGKMIHGLIQGGLLKVIHRYAQNEKTLEEIVEHDGVQYKVLGIPDSYDYGEDVGTAVFVDYKSGKENGWDNVRLASDLKMKLTAWLVWNATAKPSLVKGYIEYVPTRWNPETREVEPTGGESVMAGAIEYTSEEMEAFTLTIIKTMNDINAAYTEHLTSTDEFVNQDDVAEYAQFDKDKRDIEARQVELLQRIGDQMAFGKKESVSTIYGTFYFTAKKKWAYPDTLEVRLGETTTTLAEAEKVEVAVKAAKKRFETDNAPESITKSLGFRAKKD